MGYSNIVILVLEKLQEQDLLAIFTNYFKTYDQIKYAGDVIILIFFAFLHTWPKWATINAESKILFTCTFT